MFMTVEKTIEGVVAIIIVIMFMTMIIPALTQATGISFPFIYIGLFLMIVGIIFAVIKSWIE